MYEALDSSLYNVRPLLSVYTSPVEGIQLMTIAGYVAFVCVCFFVYKILCAAFIWLLWDARSLSYVFILRQKIFKYLTFNYKKKWNKNEKYLKN